MPDPTSIDLLRFIKEAFDWEELKTLCFQLYIQFDDLAGHTREAKGRELINYMQRVGRLPDLRAALARERPEKYSEWFGLSEIRTAKPRIRSRNPRQIFISHAHQDATFAQRLANDLRRQNYAVWIAPDSIPLGERWVEAINRALQESGIFLLVSTPAAVESEWVQDETNYAVEVTTKRHMRFIKLALEEADEPPLWTVRQHVSFQNDYETALKQLLQALKPFSAVPPPLTADTPQPEPTTGQTPSPDISQVDTLLKDEVSTVGIAARDTEDSAKPGFQEEPLAQQEPERAESGMTTVTTPSEPPKPKARQRRKQPDSKRVVSLEQIGTAGDVSLEKTQLLDSSIGESSEPPQVLPINNVHNENSVDLELLPADAVEVLGLRHGEPSIPIPELSTLSAEAPSPSSAVLVDKVVEPVTRVPPEDAFDDANSAYVEGAPSQPSNNQARVIILILAVLTLLGGIAWLYSKTTTHVVDTRVVDRGGVAVEQAFVPAGSFMMGSEDNRENEQPIHEVTLDAFWIDRTEVTNAQYAACVDDGACDPPGNSSSYTRDSYYGNPEYADYPVIYVSWDDAAAYAAWAGGRLPTEAEWEYAARGPESLEYPWGNRAPSCQLANTVGCVGDTSKTGDYPYGSSRVGALDMAGNVWEWTTTKWAASYQGYKPDDSPEGDARRVVRGGAFYYVLQYVRCAARDYNYPYYDYRSGGFRVVLSPSSTSAL